MHINSNWMRSPFLFPSTGQVGSNFVGVPTAPSGVGALGDQLSMGPGGALAAMQMQYLQALQAQAMFWMLPAMVAQAAQQLQQQGLSAGGPNQGWPQQIDPQALAMLLAHWLLNGGQMPNQGRSAGALPSGGCSNGCRVPNNGGWGSKTGGSSTSGSRSPVSGTPSTPSSAPTGRGTSGDFLRSALAQNGDRYVYGAETNLNDSNPNTFDCSELVQWAAHQAGVTIPDGSSAQLAHVRRHGQEISVEQALRTPGALLFRPGHVAISLGDGRTIEARGRRYGVGIFNARGRFTSAGLIPGMRY